LSGGLSEENASVFLNAMNVYLKQTGQRPWNLSFSFGRALQKSCLNAWRGLDENIAAAQQQYFLRAKANGEASTGDYAGGASGSQANESLFVSNYSY